MKRKRSKRKTTLAKRRWLNRAVIWPQRKINRLIAKNDKTMRIALCRCRQWGASLKSYALAVRMYRRMKNNETNSSKFKQ